MQVKNLTVRDLLPRLRMYIKKNGSAEKYANEAPPLRAELFNTQQLEHYGIALANTHRILTDRKAPDWLLKRLADNERILIDIRNLFIDAIKEKKQVTPGGEWLLDNFYLIEEQVRIGKIHLPKGYSESLPALANGASAGLPRVYDIAAELIMHTDGRIDLEGLSSFVSSYQKVTELKLGELWAIPIMLRLALIENLRRISARLASDRINRDLANHWAAQMIETAEKDPKSLILVIADMARSNPPVESAFVAELTRQLMWKGPSLALPLSWMEQRLSENGLTGNDLVNQENQKQAADQVSISNSIGSLRFLSSVDWQSFVEALSIVEDVLRTDSIYQKMDFSTRDSYRHAVEALAKRSKRPEKEVAITAMRLADGSKEKYGASHRKAHVGYYLIDKGRETTEERIHLKHSAKSRIYKKAAKHPLRIFLGAISVITLLIAGIMANKAYADGIDKKFVVLVGIAAVLVVSQFALWLTNWVATLLVKPSILPRMDFFNEIPDGCKTLVVVPSMLTDAAHAVALVESLEVRFLANRHSNLHFALLTDFGDANNKIHPGDEELVALVQKRIQELNMQYGEEKNIFFLLHRPRVWNKYDKVWMGYERKRGKLAALNTLLKTGNAESFSAIAGNLEALANTKYVITLDTDTQLPLEAAWKMIGAMAHPLNRAVYDETKKRITEGYGILQPRAAISIPGTDLTLYQRLHASDPGIDPYTRATSDVYQDLFSEGSFIGKGIYDIEAFEKTLNGRFPENRILSHDLLEGCHARSGLISDVQLYEEFPSHYGADMNRRHRWIRGDWQIARWCLPVVPNGDCKRVKNTVSALSRWKIFDNLRRSLVPLGFMVLLVLGWVVLKHPFYWTITVLAFITLPSVIGYIWNLAQKQREVNWALHAIYTFKEFTGSVLQNAFTIVTLPYEAWYNCDAIARTTWRMFVSRKKLLEWKASAHYKKTDDTTLYGAYRLMWVSPALASFILIVLIGIQPQSIPVALPFILSWVLSPGVAWWLGQPAAKPDDALNASQLLFVRRLARKTWRFFEQFAGAEDNWLPPDNYQEHPKEVVAHRTSPTNIGLSLLSGLTAYDLGYITAGTLLTRTSNTLETMGAMERYRGHLFNWYDTITLQPLWPRYISSVDSGNMAGMLLTLKQGLLELPNHKIIGTHTFEGMLDTLALAEENVKDSGLSSIRESLQKLAQAETLSLGSALAQLNAVAAGTASISEKIAASGNAEALWWVNALYTSAKEAIADISLLAPWHKLPAPPGRLKNITSLGGIPTLNELSAMDIGLFAETKQKLSEENTPEEKEWLEILHNQLQGAARIASERIDTITELAAKCVEFSDIEFDFLYDKSKHLLSIGYNLEDQRLDASCYDLLASEARLATFLAIAQGKLPQESWFAMGRLLTNTTGAPVLLSWSGSMFEYLMPLLVMPTYENTLLDQSNKSAVRKHIEYGRQRNVPWGISESGYNVVDANLNYQYRSFGVPGLGLKRGLSDDLVIAPYASALSLMVIPDEACKNLQLLSHEGFEGSYGLYEAIDYTPIRLPRGQSRAIIQSYMAHHHGMSLLSYAYVLLNKPMQRRFESELQFQAALLLLQERVPKITVSYSHTSESPDVNIAPVNAEMRIINTPHTPAPEIQLLSNGRYQLMITNAGGGYSRWKGFAVTRWREDTTCDNWGLFCYVYDLDNNIFWSNTHQPSLKPGKNYEAAFTQGRADFRRNDNNIEMHTEVVVSPEDDIEMRRIHITNRSRRRRSIEVTSYSEVILTPPAAEAAHPAFNNLFVQTELVPSQHAIICTRRPRSEGEHTPWLCHILKTHGIEIEEVSYETDRNAFIGRGNNTHKPKAMSETAVLSNSEGFVLDPIVSIRYKVTLDPGQTAVFDMFLGMSDTREGCQALIDKYQDKHLADRVLELSWAHSQVVLRQINATESDAQLYGKLAGPVIYNTPLLRTDPGTIANNHKGQSGLWGYAISGDLPIVLLKIKDPNNIVLVKQLVQAHAYWRLKGLIVDLVIWNEDHGGYRQTLQDLIMGFITASAGVSYTDRPGGIFVRPGDQVPQEDRTLIETVARAIISDEKGSLADQLARKPHPKPAMPKLVPTASPQQSTKHVKLPEGLLLFNGKGGFSADGNEYVILTSHNSITPAPWVNVIANPHFGTVVSESGQAYTWVENAHEQRLTPWSNDPVCDEGGEHFYIRDEESGYVWSPTPLPARGETPYITRHGFGYSVFEHIETDIHSEMSVFVDLEDTIKFTAIKLRNESDKPRKISVTGYIEWVLGDLRPKSAMHIVSENGQEANALFARNQYHADFANKVAFFNVGDPARTYTTDRTEFIGRNGVARAPEALTRTRLSNKAGAGFDPCAAIQTVVELLPGQEKEVIFRLGTARDIGHGNSLLRKYADAAAVHNSLFRVKQYWQKTLGNIQIKTPDAALNVLTNGWLMYQVLCSRVWARSGYYQSGGAFGFRDQLQDVMAIAYVNPQLTREQILLSASRQFREGDVQHWWHPPAGRGVRTRCSDDYLWLPFVTASYVDHTGDHEILNVPVSFLEGRPLNVDEESYYDMPNRSYHEESLYGHCVAAIKNGLRMGSNGLPLMGSGDWNDGMDMVGRHGKGESVWLAFFLYKVLVKFIRIAELRNDQDTFSLCTDEAQKLKENINKNAWDGNWYRRAYFDDGTPLGSALNDECSIDAISQSWAILSGAGEPARCISAMEAVNTRLVDRENALIQLLDPPFDKSHLNPGYIKGYVPGVRENGGQYSHAAIWTVMAYAAMGNNKLTWELLQLINPANHADTPEKAAIYKVEPYVMAADVYKVPGSVGKGGWTWYTGSAGWLYQAVLQSFFGLQIRGDKLAFKPCLPEEWESCQVRVHYKETLYIISYQLEKGSSNGLYITTDDVPAQDNTVTLVNDKTEHNIEVKYLYEMAMINNA
jgi:cellobiose phosphorylase